MYETKIFHTKLENNIEKKLRLKFNNSSNIYNGYYISTLMAV